MAKSLDDIQDLDELDYGENPNYDDPDYQPQTKSWIDYSQTYPSEDPDTDPNDYQDPDESGDSGKTSLEIFLESKGINPMAIKFTTEEGTEEIKSFDDLTPEEQLDILTYNNESHDFKDDEISLINEMRGSNMSARDYVEAIRQQAVIDYQNSLTPVEESIIDNFTDEELFIADLKDRITDLTETEAAEALSLEKQNETLFKKKMDSLRETYKTRESVMMEQRKQEEAEEAKKQFEEYESMIVKTIENNNIITAGEGSFELSPDDMDDVASFILDTDANGVRHIARAVNDPASLVKMAWFALKGQQALNDLDAYYRQVIAETSKTNYEKGYEDAKGGKSNAKSYVKKPEVKSSTPASKKKLLTLDDIS